MARVDAAVRSLGGLASEIGGPRHADELWLRGRTTLLNCTKMVCATLARQTGPRSLRIWFDSSDSESPLHVTPFRSRAHVGDSIAPISGQRHRVET